MEVGSFEAEGRRRRQNTGLGFKTELQCRPAYLEDLIGMQELKQEVYRVGPPGGGS